MSLLKEEMELSGIATSETKTEVPVSLHLPVKLKGFSLCNVFSILESLHEIKMLIYFYTRDPSRIITFCCALQYGFLA